MAIRSSSPTCGRSTGSTKQTTSNVASLSDSFDLSVTGNGDNGQTVTVTVTPNDGTEAGTPDTDTATVGNAAPVDHVGHDR